MRTLRSNLRWLLLGFGGLALAAVASLWVLQRDPCQHQELAGRLSSAAQGAAGSVVDLAAVTDFPWDTAFVVSPYTPRQEVEARLGISCPCYEASAAASRDEVQWLVFLRAGRVVAHADVGRELVAPERPIPREKARFRCDGGFLRHERGN